MNPGLMKAEFNHIHAWKVTERNGWGGAEVAGRFEAGVRGEIDSELLRIGPSLAQFAAAFEIMNVLEETDPLRHFIVLAQENFNLSPGGVGKREDHDLRSGSWQIGALKGAVDGRFTIRVMAGE